MELKEFVVKSVQDITDAIAEANAYIKDGDLGKGISNAKKTIDFDVEVVSQDDSKIGGGGKIQVAGVFSLGGSSENVIAYTHTSRIKFKIDLYLNGHQSRIAVDF